MSDSKWGTLLVLIAGLLYGAGLGAWGIIQLVPDYKADAVAAGHAEYYLDDEHERQWRWLPVGDGLSTGTMEVRQ